MVPRTHTSMPRPQQRRTILPHPPKKRPQTQTWPHKFLAKAGGEEGCVGIKVGPPVKRHVAVGEAAEGAHNEVSQAWLLHHLQHAVLVVFRQNPVLQEQTDVRVCVYVWGCSM